MRDNLHVITEEQQFREIIEDDADGLITERVTETVLVGIVDPLRHPHHRGDLRVFRLVLQNWGGPGGGVAGDHSRELLVKLGQVAILRTEFLVRSLPDEGAGGRGTGSVQFLQRSALRYQVRLCVKPILKSKNKCLFPGNGDGHRIFPSAK